MLSKSMNLMLTAILVGIFSSCTQNPSPQTLVALHAADIVILRTDTILDNQSERYLNMTKAELKNYPENVSKLLVIADSIKQSSNRMDSVLEKLQNTDSRETALYKEKLIPYKKSILSFMGEDWIACEIPIDTISVNALSRNLSQPEKTMIIHKLRNDLRFTKNICYARLTKQIYSCVESFDAYIPVIHTNSATVQIGETFETTIGIGYYLSGLATEVYIDNKKLPMDSSGKTIYSVKALKPGKYSVPVLIRRPKRSGDVDSFREEIKYTVVPK